ncbi:hypothetical protein [Hyalangium rubrum]|uniref:Uncharacterized protein n=1 Tax=Hyalangium rubrum TaxID=3103134 RepID=A0ABU5H762_9BACT|nr:hypothetical protein [Hyalangium sp. s54d21]MDY7228688.1 hypothetical protein [Hyalangium sp. s54d21]
MLALGLATLLLALPPAPGGTAASAPQVPARAEVDPCSGMDDEGRPFPTCFDPGNALLLGTGLRVWDGRADPTLHAGILLRTERTSRSKGMLWFNTHRLLVTEATPNSTRRGLTTTLYEGTFRRHLEEGFILIPTSKPIRIPFPFDVTLAVRAGHLERRTWEGPGLTVETGRAALLLDPIRSVTGRLWLGFGPAASHSLRRMPDGELEQELSPFTSALVETGYETEDGWWTVRASGLGGWINSFEGGRRFRVRADASLERILFAVNDQPLWLQAYGTYTYKDAGLARRTEWAVGARLLVRTFSSL